MPANAALRRSATDLNSSAFRSLVARMAGHVQEGKKLHLVVPRRQWDRVMIPHLLMRVHTALEREGLVVSESSTRTLLERLHDTEEDGMHVGMLIYLFYGPPRFRTESELSRREQTHFENEQRAFERFVQERGQPVPLLALVTSGDRRGFDRFWSTEFLSSFGTSFHWPAP